MTNAELVQRARDHLNTHWPPSKKWDSQDDALLSAMATALERLDDIPELVDAVRTSDAAFARLLAEFAADQPFHDNWDNAPGHAHEVKERWDGWGETRHQKPCDLCIAWNAARVLLTDQTTTQP